MVECPWGNCGVIFIKEFKIQVLDLETPNASEQKLSYNQELELVNNLDGCPSTLFLTLLICLQSSDNDFGEGDVSRGF